MKTFSRILLLLAIVLIPISFSIAQTGGSNIPPTGGSNIPPTGGSQTGQGTSIRLENPLRSGANNVFGLIRDIVNKILIPVGGVVAVMYIMYSGFLMVTAQGDAKQIETAKKGFFWAVVGTVILLGAWVISEGIQNTLNEIIRF